MITLPLIPILVLFGVLLLMSIIAIYSIREAGELTEEIAYWIKESNYWEDGYQNMRETVKEAEKLALNYQNHSDNLLEVSKELWNKLYGKSKLFPSTHEFPSRASDEGLALCEYGYDETTT